MLWLKTHNNYYAIYSLLLYFIFMNCVKVKKAMFIEKHKNSITITNAYFTYFYSCPIDLPIKTLSLKPMRKNKRTKQLSRHAYYGIYLYKYLINIVQYMQ